MGLENVSNETRSMKNGEKEITVDKATRIEIRAYVCVEPEARARAKELKNVSR